MHAKSSLDSFFYLGYFARFNKRQGTLEAFLDTDVASQYAKLEQVWVNLNNQLIPFSIKSIAVKHQKAIIAFADEIGIDAGDLIGCQMYLPVSELPELKGEKQFYYHEVIGFAAIDAQNNRNLGNIAQINTFGPQAFFEITLAGSQPLLIPVNNNLIEKVDKIAKKIVFKLPEGLIDIYRKNTK